MKKLPPLLVLLFLLGTLLPVHAVFPFPSVSPFALSTGIPSGGATWASAPTGINVTFPSGTTSKFTWSAGGGTWNWSAAAQMAVVVVNTGTAPAPLVYFVTDSTGKQLKGGVCSTSDACTWLQPGATKTVLIDMTHGTANDSLTAYGVANSPPAVTGSNVFIADAGNTGPSAPNYSAISSFYVQMLNQSGAAITINIQSLLLIEPNPISDLYTGVVDAYGQLSRGTWPNKITSLADLATRNSAEQTDLAAHPSIAGWDNYGAWTSASGTATGYFHTQQISGKWWMVAPNGHLFFSTGINHMFSSSSGTLAYQHVSDGNMGNVQVTQTRESMFQSIPVDVHAYVIYQNTNRFPAAGVPNGLYGTYDFYGANVDHKYGTVYGTGDCQPGWMVRTLARMKSWGFNTVANFSDVDEFQPTGQIPYVVYFHTAAATTINTIPDPYDPTFVAMTGTQANNMLPAYVSDTNCLGYICDNERPWGTYPMATDYLTNTALRYVVAIKTLASSGTGTPSVHPAKNAFQSQMINKYVTIGALNTAWGTVFASWTTFLNPYTVPGSPNAALIADMGSFTTAFAAQYAQSCNSIIKSRDPNHLYLGSRIAYCSPEVLAGLAQYQDVMSFNVYAPTLDQAKFAFTGTLGKPCMITEFSFGSSYSDNGMSGYGYATQRTYDQTDRAGQFTAYVQSVAALPAFVGAHWFEYIDQPLLGRAQPDGEDYNFGFVDGADTPYQPMVDAARAINAQIYNLHQGTMAIPALMEAEDTTVSDCYTFGGGGWQDIVDSTLSNAAATQLNASQNNDYITFTTPANVVPGTYNVRIGIKKGPSLGKFRLYVGDTGSSSGVIVENVSPTDEYNATPSTGITEVDLGNWTTSTTITKWFKFLIVNKNSHSSGNTIIVDYIKLQ